MSVEVRRNDRGIVELFLGALLPTTTDSGLDSGGGAPCPDLKILGLEASFAQADFPFSALERTLATRYDAGHRLARFVYRPHTRKYDGAGTRARFAVSFAALSPFVDVVEYRGTSDARACPFKSPQGRGGCWDEREAERYWTLPANLMSYDWEPEVEDVDAGPAGEVDDDQEVEVSIFRPCIRCVL